ncbi:MAG: hypothetical protein K2L80_08595 [Muribaculaceae bacterium]|nr:hypothetical protein [Muribaculaceae bacterium]MDE6332647.1 hypothetical protein [Muribaculaceae bacterium]
MKILSIAAGVFLLSAALASCGGNGGSMSVDVADTLLSVDNLYADPLAFVGDTIQVEGICTQLSRHGGANAFMQGESGEYTLRMEATAAIDGAFSPDCAGQTMLARGILCEDRVGKAEIDSLERVYMLRQEREAALGADAAEESHGHSGADKSRCSADAGSYGFDTVVTPQERLAKMRAEIDRRLKTEDKDYISYFYLKTLSYEVKE